MALPEGAPAKSATKADWAEYAIGRGVPSYEAWGMTVDELAAKWDEPEKAPTPAGFTDPNDIGPGHFPTEPAQAAAPSSPSPDDVGAGHAKTKRTTVKEA